MKIRVLIVVLFLIFLICLIFLKILKTSNIKNSIILNNNKPLSKINPALLPTVNLNTIFNTDHTWTATLPAEKVITILATGDVIPARSVNYNVVTKNDPLWPYNKVASIIRLIKKDVLFINLESPLINDCPTTTEGMIFCSDPKNIEGLKYLGVDIANLANNHLGNYGKKGIENTIDILSKANIISSGTSSFIIRNVKGLNFAFLGYNNIGYREEGINWANENLIRKDIEKAKEKADVIIVTFHFGTEYKSQPDKKQIELAHLSINTGADLVIGNHPHWIQPVEIYKGKVINYALGNFVFDQMWSEKTKEGILAKYTFFNKDLIDVEFMPIKIENYGQPYFLEKDEKERILKDLRYESLKLKQQKEN